nr:monocarboxylate transporter 10-like [Chelonoidis abingdonii]
MHRVEKDDNADNLQKESSFFYPPPDGGWGWVVVLAACTHALLVSGFHNAFGVYMISLLETFQSSRSRTGLIMVSLYFTTKRSFATGIVMAGGAAGTLVQNQVHRYLIKAFGWRTSLRVYCGILTICIFAGFAYRPLEKRRHPSVVENFQTSPLRGFIVDLSLWKDSIFELWVCALGLAKFGFFIPFVHMVRM